MNENYSQACQSTAVLLKSLATWHYMNGTPCQLPPTVVQLIVAVVGN